MWLARHRWQIPELGRWANRDLIGAGGGQNLYEYVNGNPVRHTDPFGLESWEQMHQRQHARRCAKLKDSIETGQREDESVAECNRRLKQQVEMWDRFGCDGPLALPDVNPYTPGALLEALGDVFEEGINDTDTYLDTVQDNLDIVGMAPGLFGLVADGMNVVVSVVRGNWSRAGWSLAAMVPGAGNVTQGARLTMSVGKVPRFTRIPQSHTAGRNLFWKLNGPGGKAPQRFVRVKDRKTGDVYKKTETMELHHIKSRRNGGGHTPGNYRPGWPNDHERWDKYRHTGYDVIEILEYFY